MKIKIPIISSAEFTFNDVTNKYEVSKIIIDKTALETYANLVLDSTTINDMETSLAAQALIRLDRLSTMC